MPLLLPVTTKTRSARLKDSSPIRILLFNDWKLVAGVMNAFLHATCINHAVINDNGFIFKMIFCGIQNNSGYCRLFGEEG
jgi:hypothetical protein